jgi:hypothetical protein
MVGRWHHIWDPDERRTVLSQPSMGMCESAHRSIRCLPAHVGTRQETVEQITERMKVYSANQDPIPSDSEDGYDDSDYDDVIRAAPELTFDPEHDSNHFGEEYEAY